MTRRKFDFYETPSAMVEDLIGFYGNDLFPVYSEDNLAMTVLDPCYGKGKFLMPIAEHYAFEAHKHKVRFITNDVQPDKAEYCLDMTKKESWETIGHVDLVVTNPPFNVAMEILQHAYKYSRYGVVLLLRHSFIEPTNKRGEWFKEHPPNFVRIYGSPRPSFTNKGTDTVTTDIIGWIKPNHPRYHRLTSTMCYPPINFGYKWRK